MLWTLISMKVVTNLVVEFWNYWGNLFYRC